MKKKKILTASLAVALVAIFAIGSSLAYFTDKDSARNTFTSGNVDIELDEARVNRVTDADGLATWVAVPATRVKTNEYIKLYPGAYLPKDPTIENVGENPARLIVVVDFSHEDELNALFTSMEDAVGTVIMGFNTTEFTVLANVDDTSTVYDVPANHRWVVLEYNGVFGVGDSTTVFTGINIPTTLTNSTFATIDNLTIDVIAYAVQAEAFSSWSSTVADGLYK